MIARVGIPTILLGLVLGLLAVRSRSILPGLIFHFLNNAIAVTQSSLANTTWFRPLVPWIYRNPADGLYHVPWTAASALVTVLLRPAQAGKPRAWC